MQYAPFAFVVDDGGVDAVGIRMQVERSVDGPAVVGHVAEVDCVPGCGGDGEVVEVGFGVARDA